MSSFVLGNQSSPSVSATNYTWIGASSTANSWTATESSVRLTMPATTDLSGLTVSVATAPGAGKSIEFTVMKNGSATGLVATISDTNTSAADTLGTASFAAGDTVSLRCVPTGTPTTPSIVRWTVKSSATAQPLFGISNASTSTTTLYHPLMGGGSSSTENRIQAIMPCAGSVSNLYANLSATPGVGNSKVFVLRVNGVSSALTATVSGAASSGSDTSNSVNVSAGDLVDIQVSATGTPTSSTARSSIAFTPSNSNDSVLLYGNDDDPSVSVPEYSFPVSTSAVWGSTESSTQHLMPSCTLKTMYVRTTAAAGSGKSYTLTARKNAADTSLTLARNNSTATGSISVDVDLAAGDLLSFACTPSGTPSASRLNAGILVQLATANAPTLAGISSITGIASITL